jgi:hypothetical protein
MSDAYAAGLEAALARIRVLEDQLAIRETLARYTHAVDHLGGFEEVFTGDCVLELVDTNGRVWHRETGIDEVRKYMADRHGDDARAEFAEMHVVTSLVATELVGDTARCESYFVAYRDYGNGPAVSSFGRYFDVLSKRDGRWLIQNRRGVMGSTHVDDRE